MEFCIAGYFVVSVLIAALLLLKHRRESFFALGCALSGLTLYFSSIGFASGALLFLGASFFLCMAGIPSNNHRNDLNKKVISPIWPLALIVLAELFRFYAINLVATETDWDWENNGAALLSTTFRDSVMDGLVHPGISQGFLWHIMNWISFTLFGVGLLSQRIWFALISTLLIPLFYGVASRLTNNSTALLAALLFAFSPIEIGWARNNYFFSLATFGFLLSIFTTQLVLERTSWPRIGSLVFSMAIANFFYPAAMFSFMIPIVVLSANAISRRTFVSIRVACALLCGTCLYFLLPSLLLFLSIGQWHFLSVNTIHANGANLFTRPDIDTSPLVEMRRVCDILLRFCKSLLFPINDDSYFNLSAFEPKFLIGRITLAFLSPGLAQSIRGCKRESQLLIGAWIVVGLIAGAFSTDFHIRRFGVELPLFYLLAALGITHLMLITDLLAPRFLQLKGLMIGIPCLILILLNTGLYFSNKPPHLNVPEKLAAQIEPYLQSNSLMVLAIPQAKKVIFLLHDRLVRGIADQQFAIDGAEDNSYGIPIVMYPEDLKNHWFYSNTILHTLKEKLSLHKFIFAISGQQEFAHLGNEVSRWKTIQQVHLTVGPRAEDDILLLEVQPP